MPRIWVSTAGRVANRNRSGKGTRAPTDGWVVRAAHARRGGRRSRPCVARHSLGFNPRRLQLNATRFSCRQALHFTRRNPYSRRPHSRYASNSSLTKWGVRLLRRRAVGETAGSAPRRERRVGSAPGGDVRTGGVAEQSRSRAGGHRPSAVMGVGPECGPLRERIYGTPCRVMQDTASPFMRVAHCRCPHRSTVQMLGDETLPTRSPTGARQGHVRGGMTRTSRPDE